MESIDQISALAFIGNEQVAARVDYRVCDCCGFRLMRVETTIINEQHLTAKHCPICEQFENEGLENADTAISVENRMRYFDLWLATHGLDRETLDCHYHLKAEHFFGE